MCCSEYCVPLTNIYTILGVAVGQWEAGWRRCRDWEEEWLPWDLSALHGNILLPYLVSESMLHKNLIIFLSFDILQKITIYRIIVVKL